MVGSQNEGPVSKSASESISEALGEALAEATDGPHCRSATQAQGRSHIR
jgi:hypothetical protein